jgi:membrane protein YqaA with SNARE-associated domain
MLKFEDLKRFVGRAWYPQLVAFLGALDQFIGIVPTEAVMIAGILVRPSRWLSMAIWTSTGCAAGAMLLAHLASLHGVDFLNLHFPNLMHSEGWEQASRFVGKHGHWALAIIAVSPIPQQPAVAFAGVSHLEADKVFIAVWVGRIAKMGFLAWAATHAPHLLKRLPGFGRTTMGQKK